MVQSCMGPNWLMLLRFSDCARVIRSHQTQSSSEFTSYITCNTDAVWWYVKLTYACSCWWFLINCIRVCIVNRNCRVLELSNFHYIAHHKLERNICRIEKKNESQTKLGQLRFSRKKTIEFIKWLRDSCAIYTSKIREFACRWIQSDSR
jgi:hypothetical protein